jgi:serine/threonine protein kinase/WD40 repeat protein
MVRRVDTDPIDRDERLGEAIEAYLALAEEGQAPDPEQFSARYPELGDDLREALDGLALVQGLVGDPQGPGHGLESGRRIAGYRIVRELGRGGMGIVYEAVHVGLDRPVALKVLGTHAAPDSSGRRRFLNEARTAAGLHHTHIVPVFDVGQVGGLCYYAMQRIEGVGLDRVLRHLRHDRSVAAGSSQGLSTSATTSRAGGLAGAISSSWLARSLRRPWANPASPEPPTTVKLKATACPGLIDETASWNCRGDGLTRTGGLATPDREPDDAAPPFEPPRGSAYYRWVSEIGRQAAEALEHAHHRGIVHRDIKPSNLLVDGRGIVWVADFGLARRLADPSQTQQDSLLGTPRYMSPEQARIGPIDGRSDVYSLGATLYELLTLRPPFEGRTAAELVEQISGREPVAPRHFDSRIPRDLETILLKTLAKRPADRYLTAQDLADDLTRFLSHEPVRARRISPVGRLWRFARRHPSLTIVSTTAAATVLAVVTGAYVRILQKHDQVKKAWVETQQAMRRTEDANRATQAAMRELLWRQAELVRRSNQPNSRMRGLGLLKRAAALGPDPALAVKLRDEGVKFLMLRDVEARPGFATGPTRALAFAADGARLATVQDSGEELGFWDVERRQLVARSRLQAAGAAPSNAFLPGGGRWGAPGANSIAEVGQGLVAILSNGHGLRLFDAVTGEFVRDLKTPDRQILALFAVHGGGRLVTVERTPQAGPGRNGRGGAGDTPGPKPGGPGGPGPEGGPRGDYTVNLWDPERWAPEDVGQPIATLARWELPNRTFFLPLLVAISPDGAVVAAALPRTSAVAYWSTDDGSPLGEIETAGELSALALGPDGLMATAAGGTIQFWDTDSDVTLGQITPHQSLTRLLRFHPRGTLLAAAGTGAEIELWDPSSRELVAVLPAGEADRSEPPRGVEVEDLAFSPDGHTLVASGHGSTTPTWAIVNPVAQTQLSGFDSWPLSLAFREDGLLAVGSGKGGIWFWQTGQGACTLQRVRGGSKPGDPPAASPTAASPGTNPAPANPAAGGKPTSLAFDDHDRLLVLDGDSLQGWDQPAHDAEVFRLPLPPSKGFGGGGPGFNGGSWRQPLMARAQDGRMLFLARQSQILAWDSSQPDHLRPLTVPPLPEPPGPERDGRRRPEPPGPERDGRRRGMTWQAMVASPDGTRLYLIAPDPQGGRVHALACEGDRARWLDWSPRIHATALALSPDARTLAVGDRQGSVTLIDTARGVENARLRPPTGEADGQISSLAFAPDRRELAVGTQHGQVDLWSLDHPSAPRLHLPGHRGSVHSLVFDPQGRHLASAGIDRTIEVWDLNAIRDELGPLGLAW